MSNTGVTNLGSCWSCASDLTMPAVMVGGNRCVAEAIIRRWSTTQGELLDDPTYGFNLNDLVNASLSHAQAQYAQQQAGAQAQLDERVLSCIVQLQPITVAGVLTVNALVTTATGPFQLVAEVSAVTVALLQVSP